MAKPLRITEQSWPEGTVPLVSICCATYNHEKFIRDAIEGFLMQETTFPVEIIVRDDASTDGTAGIVREYAAKYPALFRTILYSENQFVAGKRALTEFIRIASGTYIAICEGDDYWTVASKLEAQVACLESQPELSQTFHPARFQDLNSQTTETWGPSLKKDTFTLDEFLSDGNFIPTCSIMFRRGCALDFLNLPPGSYFADYCLHAICAISGPLGFLDLTASVYRRHSGGMYSSLATMDAEIAKLKTFYFLGNHLGLTGRSSYDIRLDRYFQTLKRLCFQRGYIRGPFRACLHCLKALPQSFRMRFLWSLISSKPE